ncbi:lipocalin family protein [Nibricoccus aquaticus]|nr:lipocalin family protein [Nibricoccus aquaticus]
MSRTLLAAIAVITLTLSGCMSTSSSKPARDLTTVKHVDLARYMGDWHVIAHIPYVLEKGKVATTDRYRLREDGKIETTFLFRKESLDAPQKQWNGVSWVVDKTTNAEWRVQFIWPLRAAYRVLELDADYRWAVVSSGDGDLIWILSRARTMDDATYTTIVEKVRSRGLGADELARVLQPVR